MVDWYGVGFVVERTEWLGVSIHHTELYSRPYLATL